LNQSQYKIKGLNRPPDFQAYIRYNEDMVLNVAKYVLSVLLATFTLSFFALPSGIGMGGHHQRMDHGNTVSCVKSCTSVDRPQLASKLNIISNKKQLKPAYGALFAIAALVITAYYHLRPKRLFTLPSWRPPDRILLSGLYHTSL